MSASITLAISGVKTQMEATFVIVTKAISYKEQPTVSVSQIQYHINVINEVINYYYYYYYYFILIVYFYIFICRFSLFERQDFCHFTF